MHGESCFSDWETQNSNTPYRAGFKKVTLLGMSYYVLPEVFREELCAGFDYRVVTRLLLAEGWLEPGEHQAPYRRELFAKCWTITLLCLFTKIMG